MTDIVSSTPVPSPLTDAVIREAYLAMLERSRALAESDVVRHVTLDPMAAAETVIGAAKDLAPFEAALVAQFGPVAAETIARLPLAARATLHAQAQLAIAARPTDLSALAAEVGDVHDVLEADLSSLVARKRIDRERLSGLRGQGSYRGLYGDVLQMVALCREHLPIVLDKTGLTEAELDAAEAAANRLATAMAEREAVGERASEALDIRNRMLTGMLRDYEETRRMLWFLRWYEKDADAITPSLWSATRRRRSPEVEPEPTPPAAPVAPEGGPFTS